jgi:hypothetical protein
MLIERAEFADLAALAARYTDHTTREATGATVVPFGVGETQLQIRTIREL